MDFEKPEFSIVLSQKRLGKKNNYMIFMISDPKLEYSDLDRKMAVDQLLWYCIATIIIVFQKSYALLN